MALKDITSMLNPQSRAPRCSNCPGCGLHHIWHVALCDHQRIVLWTGVRSESRQDAEDQARARGFYEGAALDNLEVDILSDLAPRWWADRAETPTEWAAHLWPSVREQLADALGDFT